MLQLDHLPILGSHRGELIIEARSDFTCDDCEQEPTPGAVLYNWLYWDGGFLLCEKCHQARLNGTRKVPYADDTADAEYHGTIVTMEKRTLDYLFPAGSKEAK